MSGAKTARPGVLTRRGLLVRGAWAGLSISGLAAALAACGSGASSPAASGPPSGAPSPSGRGGGPSVTPALPSAPVPSGPVVLPAPVSARYGPLLPIGVLDLTGVASATLAARAREVAAAAGLSVAPGPSNAPAAARVTVVADDPAYPPEGYRLTVSADGPGGAAAIEVRASAEAGAWNGLLSLGQLFAAGPAGSSVRAAEIEDGPGFARRGAILDPYVLPHVGVTEASKAVLMGRLAFAVRYKANFLGMVDRTPWPELVAYCRDHHVELMNAMGYQNWIVDWGPAEWRRRIDEKLDAGTRSIALCFDDVPVDDGTALATAHAAAYVDLYDYIRGREPDCRMSAVLSPYGGIPGAAAFGRHPEEGARYLAIMKARLPADVRVFWTGDGGVFSPTVTASGARAYRDAVGRELGFWDNDAISWAAYRTPCRGRAPDLASVVTAYMVNVAGPENWRGTNGEFALLTSLLYAWNPGDYDPDRAAAAAEQVTAGPPPTGGAS